jgi:hypothetical protein
MRRSGVVTKMKMFLQSIFTLLVAVEGRSALRTAGLRLRALSQNPPAAPVARFSTKGEGGSPSPKDWMAFLSGIPAAAVVATATAGLAAAIGGDAHDDSTQDCTANAEPPQRVQPGARIGDEPESVTKPNDPVQELVHSRTRFCQSRLQSRVWFGKPGHKRSKMTTLPNQSQLNGRKLV